MPAWIIGLIWRSLFSFPLYCFLQSHFTVVLYNAIKDEFLEFLLWILSGGCGLLCFHNIQHLFCGHIKIHFHKLPLFKGQLFGSNLLTDFGFIFSNFLVGNLSSILTSTLLLLFTLFVVGHQIICQGLGIVFG